MYGCVFVVRRDRNGRFMLATIVAKNKDRVRMHFDGWLAKWDEWVDFTKEPHRFARPYAVHRRARHRLKDVRIGGSLEVNPRHNSRHIAVGWVPGRVRTIDENSLAPSLSLLICPLLQLVS